MFRILHYFQIWDGMLGTKRLVRLEVIHVYDVFILHIKTGLSTNLHPARSEHDQCLLK